MNTQHLTAALHNLENHNTRFNQYELRLAPDGSGSIFAVFKPEIPAHEAVMSVATKPELYEAEVSFDNLDELDELAQRMMNDPGSIEFTLCSSV